MSRFYLLFHGRFPSEKAASLFAAKSAEAFAKQGKRVVLLVPRRKGVLKDDPFVYYGIEKNFDIVRLGIIDFFDSKFVSRFAPRVAFWTSFITFSVSAFFYSFFKTKREDLFYSNETLPLFFLSFLRCNTLYEMHDFPESKLNFFRRFLGRMRWVLIHNKWKLEETKKLFPETRLVESHRKTKAAVLAKSKYFYEPNAMDLAAFDTNLSKKEARKQLSSLGLFGMSNESILLNAKIVVYTGHLYTWKGVDALALAAGLSPDTIFIFVGGTDSDVESFKRKYGVMENIRIVGHRQHSEIPLWQKAADVLVLPNTAKEKISAYYTSPMKLFEYMASRRPIVATDIPSLRDIVDDESVLFVAPDNPKALASGIAEVLSDPQRAEALATHAFDAVLSHTWDKRAERIVHFVSM
jgi:glycosyltransferase involved in cell wall biosynthesis